MRLVSPALLARLRGLVEDNLTTSLVFRRSGTNLDAQNVRLWHLAPEVAIEGSVVGVAGQRLGILGTVSLDVAVGDVFTYNSQRYEVVHVRPLDTDASGRIAEAERRQ